MASAGVNVRVLSPPAATCLTCQVLRWSALGLGVFYGIYHQSTIRAHDRQHSKQEATKAEFREREQLISQAKAEFARSNGSAAPASSGGESSTEGVGGPSDD
jgi:F-type H+-transporting ATP synthase subunit e